MNSIVTPSINTRTANILLVEDNPDDVILTRHAFKKAKITNALSVAMSGEEGLAMLRQEGKYSGLVLPDLILLDLNLPGISGHDLLRAIKGNDKLQHIPIIILSSSSAENDIRQSTEAHANGYLTKPLKVDHFDKIIREIEAIWFTIVVV